MKWMTSAIGESAICPVCGCSLTGYTPSSDHHPVKCIQCGEQLVVVSTATRSAVVGLNYCPEEIRRFLMWSHDSLDELEFVSLVVMLEELLGVNETAGQ